MSDEKIIAGIDWPKFGRAVKACSIAAGSYRKLVEQHEGITVSMVSRAVNASDAHPVSAASFLHLCSCLDLDVWHFYRLNVPQKPRFKKVRSFKDIIRNQTVSASVSREMFGKRRSFADRELPRKGADGQSAFIVPVKRDRASSPSAGTEREAVRDNKR